MLIYSWYYFDYCYTICLFKDKSIRNGKNYFKVMVYSWKHEINGTIIRKYESTKNVIQNIIITKYEKWITKYKKYGIQK